MKKLFLLTSITVSIFLVVISSCKKSSPVQLSNWNCHCVMTNSNGSYSVDIVEDGLSQGDAYTQCSQQQVSHTSATTSAACQVQQL